MSTRPDECEDKFDHDPLRVGLQEDRMSTREERWATAIKEATYAGDVAHAICSGPLHEQSDAYTSAFEAVMNRFFRTEGLVCPECNTPTPSGRCAHCDGEVYEGAMSGPSRP